MPATPDPSPQRLSPREIRYEDFDVEIRRDSEGNYVVTGSSDLSGKAQETVRFPFDKQKMALQQDKLRTALERGKTRHICLEDVQPVQDIGKELFNAIFTGNVLRLYDKSSSIVAQQEMGLRLRLYLNAPELVSYPWEFLHDPQQGDYICFSRNTPVVRYLELPQKIKPISLKPPIHILCMVASPRDCDPLNVAREKEWVEKAVKPLVEQGVITLKWAEDQTWQYLQNEMREGQWNIFHFIGHGGFDKETNEGYIALADKDGNTDRLYARELAQYLADHKSLGLVVLNCCESARSGQQDVISGTSSVLIRSGIPAVIAMQYAISDEAAIVFSGSFYDSLADGYPIDASMAEARKAMRQACKGTVEWGTPVLYLRSSDGVLFTIDRTKETPQVPPVKPEPIPVIPAVPVPAGQQTEKAGGIKEPLGIFLTGFIVMWLVFYFIVRFQQFTIEILGGIMAVIFGGLILYFIQLSNKKNVWNYPIGLFIGFIAFQFVVASGMFGPLLLYSPGSALAGTTTTAIPTVTVTPLPPQTTAGVSPTPRWTLVMTQTPTPATSGKIIVGTRTGYPSVIDYSRIHQINVSTASPTYVPTTVSTTGPVKVLTTVPTTAPATVWTTVPVPAQTAPASRPPSAFTSIPGMVMSGILLVVGIGMSALLSRRK